ncbi:MAG TPA: condensation domain-containing protein, partial [Hymenobacter sp.]|nr:condensation domain-containing protein [Hymenobacter sp.]
YEPALLIQTLTDGRVTLLQGTPSLLSPLLAALPEQPGVLPALSTLCIGGESLNPALVEAVNRKLPHVRLNNHYGPTEATIDATALLDVQTFGHNNIGKPVPNTQVYLLDDAGVLTPMGLPGELTIGGAGLARGYLNQPALTHEKFVANPFSEDEHARLYKTGDLARWRPDGTLEFLGRKDAQVKIRGYRIELGEIAHALNRLPGVQQCFVTTYANAQGNKRLVAYVVSPGVDKAELRAQLIAKLPEYMVPATYVQLAHLPRNASGKVDVKALPTPEFTGQQSDRFAAPANEIEVKLGSIWQELLGLEQVGVHDNFFELGGDSIITIQVVSRAKRHGLLLQPRDLFEHQTIRQLAQRIAQQTSAWVGEQGVLTGELPLLPIQQQWFLEGEYPEMSHFNQSILLSIDKAFDEPMLSRAVDTLLVHHDALRLRYTKAGTQWHQYYGDVLEQLWTEDLRTSEAATLSHAIAKVCAAYQAVLDITAGVVAKFVWIQTPASERENRLFIVSHHLAVDGVSWRILMDDLNAVLKATRQGEPIHLGEKGSSYREYGQALQRYAGQQRTEQQLEYWKSVGEKFKPLPVDYPAESAVMNDVADQSWSLDQHLTEKLLQRVSQAYGTEINEILLTALALTISQWSNHPFVVVGLEGHGREDIAAGLDITNTVGWFTNLYPVALTLAGAESIGERVKSVKEQLRAIPDKGMGYGALRFLHPAETVRQQLAGIRWEIVFNYLGQMDNLIGGDAYLRGAPEPKGKNTSDHTPFHSRLEINSSVSGGQLHLSWTYSTKVYQEETIRTLAQSFLAHLGLIIEHCSRVKNRMATPADYGLTDKIHYADLDRFLDGEENGHTRREAFSSLYSLSPLQEGMIFHGLYDQSSTAYTEQISCDLTDVDTEALKKSWAYILKNHTVFRTSFYYDALNVPVQCVHKQVPLPFEILDYSGWPTEQREKLSAFFQQDVARGFNFKEAPLMRITLVKLDEHTHAMVWTSHHILMDGWSMPIVLKELLSAYEYYRQGSEPPAVAEDQYEAYIKYIQAKDPYAEEAFWRQYVSGVHTPTLLPFIGLTNERNKGGGTMSETDLVVDARLTDELRDYAKANRITINTLVQAVWTILLAKYTGQKHALFGVTVSGRPADLSSAEQGVGLYINTLPLYTEVDNEKAVADWLVDLQNNNTQAREFQYTALSKIQKWSHINGELFDTTLAFENFPIEKELANPWALRMSNVRSYERNNYLLSLTVRVGAQLAVNFRYNESLLNGAVVAQSREHFDGVLRQIV